MNAVIMTPQDIMICEDEFYSLLEDEIMNVNVFLEMIDEGEREPEFTDEELLEYMELLDKLQGFIDKHTKKRAQ